MITVDCDGNGVNDNNATAVLRDAARRGPVRVRDAARRRDVVGRNGRGSNGKRRRGNNDRGRSVRTERFAAVRGRRIVRRSRDVSLRAPGVETAAADAIPRNSHAAGSPVSAKRPVKRIVFHHHPPDACETSVDEQPPRAFESAGPVVTRALERQPRSGRFDGIAHGPGTTSD
ncbi:Hypothetical protein CINCED_3A015130 [Cinara cedri]|uniref:Uncharacterized protein n=1 Tax=Cinara cedri TaxID=506608 RepID=A0A5E4MTW5_9HEMI|nr:Hypothetical protein CINCED_3A015130 [Cinara cedri]